jgi:hypothetical protein
VEQKQASLEKAAVLVVGLYEQDAAQYAAERVTLLGKPGGAMGTTAWQRVLPVVRDILRERATSEERQCI